MTSPPADPTGAPPRPDRTAALPKPAGYFGVARHDLVALLPRPLGRVLDVGCGEGATAAVMREQGAHHITGIELDPEAAHRARGACDVVLEGPVEDRLTDLEGPFDTILCLDVLEHLAEPRGVLRALRERAADGATLEVSVPNARHLSLAFDLVVRGTFGYADWGHRDRTHLRWFTRRDLVAELETQGWGVTHVQHGPLARTAGLARLTGGRSAEWTALQWYVLAVAR